MDFIMIFCKQMIVKHAETSMRCHSIVIVLCAYFPFESMISFVFCSRHSTKIKNQKSNANTTDDGHWTEQSKKVSTSWRPGTISDFTVH